MIPVPSGVRVWLSVGRTDMRRGMNGLALQVQENAGTVALSASVMLVSGALVPKPSLLLVASQ